MKVGPKSQGEASQKILGSPSKLHDVTAELGICFPIHVFVLVFLKPSSYSQTESKSKTAILLKSFWLFVQRM